MNWYHREEHRYVEYGSSFRAAQRFGIARQLTDTVYNMNRAHLSPDTPTVFETLDDADVRTAGTTYLMYRGRHRHEPQRDTALTRVASTLMRHAVMGPRELFYADIFASRRTGCRSGLGMPGRARPPLRLRLELPGRARPVRLPAAVAARQRLVLAQARPRGAGAVDRAGRPAAGARDARPAGGIERVPARARGDRDGRPLPGAGHRRIALQDELAELGVLGPLARARAARPNPDRRLPFPARGDGLRAARARARRDARLGRRARARRSRGSIS